MLLNAAFETGQWRWASILVFGSLLTVVYVLKVVKLAFVAQPAIGYKRCPLILEWTALFLAIAAIVLGLVSDLPINLMLVGAPVTGPVLAGGEL